MTIRTCKRAFVEFGLHLGPTTSISFGGNPKVFSLRILVVKFQRLDALVISTKFATASFVVYGFLAQYSSPFCDGLNQVLSPVSVTSSVSFQASPSQPHALPLSYRGICKRTSPRKNDPDFFSGFIQDTRISPQCQWNVREIPLPSFLPLINVISEHRCSSCALTFLPFRTIFGTDANVRRQENA